MTWVSHNICWRIWVWVWYDDGHWDYLCWSRKTQWPLWMLSKRHWRWQNIPGASKIGCIGSLWWQQKSKLQNNHIFWSAVNKRVEEIVHMVNCVWWVMMMTMKMLMYDIMLLRLRSSWGSEFILDVTTSTDTIYVITVYYWLTRISGYIWRVWYNNTFSNSHEMMYS